MTVSATTASETFNCDGSTDEFTCPFRVLASTEVLGYLITVSTGASSELDNGVDFTVSGVGADNCVVTTTDTYSALYQVKFRRRTDRLQETDYRDNDPFPAESHETGLDRLTMIVQEHDEDIARSIRGPISEEVDEMPAAADRADKLLSFDSDGHPIAVAPTEGTATALAVSLATSSGSNDIGFIQSGSGAVSTTVQTELRHRWRPEQFGTWTAGVHSADIINRAIEACYAAGGGIVELAPGRTYSVNPATSPIKIRSGVILDGKTRATKIKRIGTNTTANLVQNYTYSPGTGVDTNIGVMNLTVEGNATNDTATQDHTAVGGCIFLYGVDTFFIHNVKVDQANSNGIGWREAHNGVLSHFEGGSFGANLFAPTSGLNNHIINCDFDFDGLTGALPGECIDIENNSALEVSSTHWCNVKAKSITFVDQWTLAGGLFAHQAQFSNFTCTGGSPRTFRVIATNQTRAKNFRIGDTCRIAVSLNSATALEIGNVDDIVCDATLSNDAGTAGTSRAIALAGPANNLIFDGVIGGTSNFNNGIDASSYALTNSIILDANLGNVTLGASSSGNDFGGCTISSLTLSGAGTVNNRFRSSTRITGSITLASSASLGSNLFETPSNGGIVTVTSATYSVVAADRDVIVNNAGTVTLTLPAASDNPWRRLTIRTIQAQAVASNASNVVPRIGGAAGTAILPATDGAWCELVSDGTNWQIMAGS